MDGDRVDIYKWFKNTKKYIMTTYTKTKEIEKFLENILYQKLNWEKLENKNE